MKALANAVKRAAQIREESFNQEAFDKGQTIEERILKGSNHYRVSLRDACDQAAKEEGFDIRGTEPVYLLLTNSWNNALEWAETMED